MSKRIIILGLRDALPKGYSMMETLWGPTGEPARHVLKTQEPVPSPYNLRIPTGDCTLLSVSGAQVKVLPAKTGPKNAVRAFCIEVGALFRLKVNRGLRQPDGMMRQV
jgi:hypothetical protein